MVQNISAGRGQHTKHEAGATSFRWIWVPQTGYASKGVDAYVENLQNSLKSYAQLPCLIEANCSGRVLLTPKFDRTIILSKSSGNLQDSQMEGSNGKYSIKVVE